MRADEPPEMSNEAEESPEMPNEAEDEEVEVVLVFVLS